MHKMHRKSYWILRICLAIVFIWFGVDKLLSPNNWFDYVPTMINDMPFKINTFIILNGMFEVILGLMLLWRRTLYLASGVIVLFIAMITIFLGFDEVIVRNLGLLSVALALFMWKK